MSTPATDVISPVSEIPTGSENGSMVGGCHRGNPDKRYINFTRLCCDVLRAGEWNFFKWLITNYYAVIDFDYIDHEGNNVFHNFFSAADEHPYVIKALQHIFARENIPIAVLNQANRYGSTPLHIAARRSHPFVHKLISHMLHLGAERKRDQFDLMVMTDVDSDMYDHRRRRNGCRSHQGNFPIFVEAESVERPSVAERPVVEVVVDQVKESPNLADLIKIFEKPQPSELRNLEAYTFSPTSPSSIQLQLDRNSDGLNLERHITGNMQFDSARKSSKTTGQTTLPFFGGTRGRKMGSVEGHRQMTSYSDIDGYVSSASYGSSDMEGGRKKGRRSGSLKRENDKKNALHTEALKKIEQFMAKVTIPKEFKGAESYLVRAIKAVVYEELKNEEKEKKITRNGFERANLMVKIISDGKDTLIKDIFKKSVAKLKEIIEHLQTKTTSSEPKKAKGGRRKKRSSSVSSLSSSSMSDSTSLSDISD